MGRQPMQCNAVQRGSLNEPPANAQCVHQQQERLLGMSERLRAGMASHHNCRGKVEMTIAKAIRGKFGMKLPT